MKTFFELFDKKIFFSVLKLIILLLIFIVTLNTLNITYSRYESGAISSAEASVAFFIIESGTYENSISLSDMVPSSTSYSYDFTVSNFNNTNRCRVNMIYTITFTATTNLPLTFKIYKDSVTTDIVSTNTLTTNNDGVYYRTLTTGNDYTFSYSSDETHLYTLVVDFPLSYKNEPTLYQGLKDLFTITINAEQVV